VVYTLLTPCGIHPSHTLRYTRLPTRVVHTRLPTRVVHTRLLHGWCILGPVPGVVYPALYPVWYTRLCTPPGIPGYIHHLVYPLPYYTLGTPPSHTTPCTALHVEYTALSHREAWPWAQQWRISWVRGL